MNPIPGDKSAVLVIDVQSGLFNASPAPYDGPGVVRRINEITARARSAGVPVFFTQQDGGPEDNLVPLTPGWRLHPDLVVNPEDRVFRKKSCDAFFETPLESELRSRGIEWVVITGFATDFCIDATVRNALSREFSVVVVEDAHTTTDSPVLAADLIRKHHNWAWPNCASKHPVVTQASASVRFSPDGS